MLDIIANSFKAITQIVGIVASYITVGSFIYSGIKILWPRMKTKTDKGSSSHSISLKVRQQDSSRNLYRNGYSLWDRFWIAFGNSYDGFMQSCGGYALVAFVVLGAVASTSYRGEVISLFSVIISCYVVVFGVVCSKSRVLKQIKLTVLIRYYITALFAVATVYSLHYVDVPQEMTSMLVYYAFCGVGLLMSFISVSLSTGSAIHSLKNSQSHFNKDWFYLVLSITGFLLVSGIASNLWQNYSGY